MPRGNFSELADTRTMQIEGWPPATVWLRRNRNERRLDPYAARQIDEIREQIMMAWTGGYAKNPAIVSVTFVGAASKCEFQALSGTVIKLLHAAGVLRSTNHPDISGCSFRARRGPIERMEIEVRQIKPEKDDGAAA